MAEGVRIEDDGATACVLVCGEVDIALTPAIDAAVEGLRGRDVVIDLRHVSFMGSTGLASLLRAKRQTETDGNRLALRAPSRQVREVLDMTRLTSVFTIVDD